MIVDTFLETQIDTRKNLELTSKNQILRSMLLSKIPLLQHHKTNLVYLSCSKKRQG